ncbi:hypothetical protein BGZ95_008153 [Linnemannia exigua]|uniref:Glucosidase 2 subunit beta n=1 Tax=Linnemannia exigua TaxID=604196 RepID=A0AAD4DEJ0_9FUNG|nr:hypothetical protein BGZ95_008153 [Linnemannia exigua]
MRIIGIPIVITLALSLVQADVTNNSKLPRGVAPSRAKVYTPDAKGLWACLDGSKSIPFMAVNDDYCDCADGSDEPGTSACGTGYFHCQNIGHTPAYIKTSRLNDGVCDPECCDGSDEFDGEKIHCPNICQQVGAASRKEREKLEGIHREGNKIRKEYVAFGQSSKKRLQEQLDKLQAASAQVKQTAADTKAELDAANAKLKEHLESTKLEREAARLLQLAPLIEQQNGRLSHATKIRTLFRETLDELKEKHNKNYHDLAVKSTIAGYDEYLEELKKQQEDEDKEAAENIMEEKKEEDRSALERMHSAQDATYEIKKDIGLMFQLIKEMKESYNTEYNDEAVLKAIKVLDDFTPTWEDSANEFVGEDPIEIPDEDAGDKKVEAKPEEKEAHGGIYSRLRKGANSIGLGFLFKNSKATKSEVEIAQEAYNKASEEERKSLDEIQKLEKKVQTDYGPDEAFAKLVDQCIEFKDHEYTYSVCMFGDAKQKSHSDTSLGTFESWEGDKYDTQLYTGGTKCWNGPERSVKVTMTCGKENKILSVSEPSKCEYLYKMETPAICQDLSGSDNNNNNSDSHEAVYPGSKQQQKKHDEL